MVMEEREKELKREMILKQVLLFGTKSKLVLNRNSEDSFFSFSPMYIHIGLKDILDKEIAMSLFYHETGHELYSEKVEEIEMPFYLLNIFEDHRIEWSLNKEFSINFAKMHKYFYGKVYRKKETTWFPFGNLVILRRWEKWIGEDLISPLLSRMSKKPEWFGNLDQIIQDIDKALTDAEASVNTKMCHDNTLWFYEKYKDYLVAQPPTIGGFVKERLDKDQPDASASEESEIERQLSSSPSEEEEQEREWSVREEDINPDLPRSDHFSSRPLWDIDKNLVNVLRNKVKEVITISRREVMTSSPVGKRVNPRKVENLLPNPFRKKNEMITRGIPKILLAIDGSGSMHGKPFWDAIHLALAMEKELGADVCLTTPDEVYKVKAKDLVYAKCSGFTENLRGLRNLVNEYDLIILFTDANVNRDDEEFLRKNKKRKVIGCLTTYDLKRAKNWLPNFFERYIVASDITSLAKELVFLVRRG